MSAVDDDDGDVDGSREASLRDAGAFAHPASRAVARTAASGLLIEITLPGSARPRSGFPVRTDFPSRYQSTSAKPASTCLRRLSIAHSVDATLVAEQE
jgi:hypothetical protein